MKQEKTKEFPEVHSSCLESPKAGNEEDEGEIFGVILSRSCSVSFASTIAVRAEKENSALENAVKKAFCMRRSSSVSRGYYKTFHHCDPVAENASKSRKKRSKIFEACRRLIGI